MAGDVLCTSPLAACSVCVGQDAGSFEQCVICTMCIGEPLDAVRNACFTFATCYPMGLCTVKGRVPGTCDLITAETWRVVDSSRFAEVPATAVGYNARLLGYQLGFGAM